MKPIPVQRQRIEKERHQHKVRRGFFWWAHWENMPWLEESAGWLLRLAGVYQRGLKNLFDTRIERPQIVLSHLPRAFDGFRILWISDLHADCIEGLIDHVLALAASLEYDLCVLGGDWCFNHYMTDDAARAARKTASTLAAKTPVYAIFGNHDYSQLAPILENAGAKLLLNDHIAFERAGEKLWFIGVDDTHYFKAADLNEALKGVPEGACKILLSHSPELNEPAARKGLALCLCGHTHGGQICLPNGFAPVYSADAPRRCIKGVWTYKGMTGYTSRGAGASGVAARFNCPPEISLITLKCS
ncbi:MAG: metallophosphoesterase [Planctomycetaceae bacterium]|nr:metallophosphoesterase [Planctomycetaceae bacterium]